MASAIHINARKAGLLWLAGQGTDRTPPTTWTVRLYDAAGVEMPDYTPEVVTAAGAWVIDGGWVELAASVSFDVAGEEMGVAEERWFPDAETEAPDFVFELSVITVIVPPAVYTISAGSRKLKLAATGTIAEAARLASLLWMCGQTPGRTQPTDWTVRLYDEADDELTGYTPAVVSAAGGWDLDAGSGEGWKVGTGALTTFSAAGTDWPAVAKERWFPDAETVADFVFTHDVPVSVLAGLSYTIPAGGRVLEDNN